MGPPAKGVGGGRFNLQLMPWRPRRPSRLARVHGGGEKVGPPRSSRQSSGDFNLANMAAAGPQIARDAACPLSAGRPAGRANLGRASISFQVIHSSSSASGAQFGERATARLGSRFGRLAALPTASKRGRVSHAPSPLMTSRRRRHALARANHRLRNPRHASSHAGPTRQGPSLREGWAALAKHDWSRARFRLRAMAQHGPTQ